MTLSDEKFAQRLLMQVFVFRHGVVATCSYLVFVFVDGCFMCLLLFCLVFMASPSTLLFQYFALSVILKNEANEAKQNKRNETNEWGNLCDGDEPPTT